MKPKPIHPFLQGLRDFMKGVVVAVVLGPVGFVVALMVPDLLKNYVDWRRGGSEMLGWVAVFAIAIAILYIYAIAPLGGVLGLVVRTVLRRGASPLSATLFACSLGTIFANLVSILARSGMMTHYEPGAYTFDPGPIYPGTVLAGLLCGVGVTFWVERGTRGAPPNLALSVRIHIATPIGFLISYLIFHLVWKTQVLYNRAVHL